MPVFYHVGTALATRAIKDVAQLDQCLGVDKWILAQGHRRTVGTVKHPPRNLETSGSHFGGSVAVGNDAPITPLQQADWDGLPEEGMPGIANFPILSLVCFVLGGCITERGRTWRWTRTRRSLAPCNHQIGER